VILHGDCFDQMKLLSDNSVDSIVTDPPYGLSFMGKKWDYDVPSVAIWIESLRVLKPGGHLLSFGGTRTFHRLACNIEDAGFEIRDQIQWLYGSGFPKSHNLKDEWQGWGTALKPANEPICLARKPLEKGLTVAENVQKWGCGAINVDASRIAGAIPVVPQPKFNSTGAIYNMKTDEGRNGEMSRAEGRWPANVLFDEEAAEMLDAQVGDNVSRFFYVAKASKRERNAGLEVASKFNSEIESASLNRDDSGNPNTRGRKANPIDCITQNKKLHKDGNFHPTVKPIKLMEYLIKLITPPNGTVLDPFMGSGSTGVAAKRLGFGFVGIERELEYVEIAQKRIEAAL